MNCYIRAIILWPSLPQVLPRLRELEFKPGAINILPGENRTGKTSIISVIEYCLGHDGCSIPRQPLLRDAVAWYGIILNFGTERSFGHDVLVARRSPGTQDDKSNEFHIEEDVEGNELQVPESISVNCTRSHVLERLAKLSGIATVNLIEADDGSSVDEREAIKELSFFDVLPFCLLPNDVLTSPYELFFLRNVRGQAIKRILPLAAGAVDDEMLQFGLQLQTQRQRRNEAKREREKYRLIAQNLRGAILDVMSKAITLKLLSPEDRMLSAVDALPRLRMLLAMKDEIMADAQLLDEKQATQADVAQLATLRMEEHELNAAIEALRIEKGQIAFLRGQIVNYRDVLREQRGRAAGVSWFNERLQDAGACPTCHTASDIALQEVRELGRALTWLRAETDKVALPYLGEEDAIRARLKQIDREERKLMERRRTKTLGIAELRQRVPGLEPKAAQTSEARKAELFGLIQFVVGQAHEVERFDLLEKRLEDAERQIRETTEELKDRNLRGRKLEAMSAIEAGISRWARQFELPRSDDYIKFSDSSLALRFLNDGVERRLAALGSSENYMGYHVAAFLAFHERFRGTHLSPVPEFIFFDSPSNVDASPGGATDMLLRVYRGIDDSIHEAAGALQVIVTERPGLDDVWSRLRTAHVVQDWNGRLVPDSWGSME